MFKKKTHFNGFHLFIFLFTKKNTFCGKRYISRCCSLYCCRDIKFRIYWVTILTFRSCDGIGHVTVGLALRGFLWVVCWYLLPIWHGNQHILVYIVIVKQSMHFPIKFFWKVKYRPDGWGRPVIPMLSSSLATLFRAVWFVISTHVLGNTSNLLHGVKKWFTRLAPCCGRCHNYTEHCR